MIRSGYGTLNDNNQNQIMENFRNVLESAYDNYEDINEAHDFIGICLNTMNESNSFINEAINFQSNEDNVINESIINEATNVTDAKIVKEGKGKGISVKVNGKEYRYVSPTRSTEDLFRSFNGMLSHGKAGYKALQYLMGNALQYYVEDARDFSQEGRDYVGYEGD